MRKNRITFTEQGKLLTEECLQADWVIWERVFHGFSLSEGERLAGYYDRMIGNIQQMGV